MSICIITESSSDMDQKRAQKIGVNVLPIQLHIGDEDYSDGVNLTKDRFYELLIEGDALPKTSQITPFEYEKAIQQAREKGDDVLVITIATELSGCYRNALFASEEYKEHVRVIDSRSACLGQYVLVERASQLAKSGKSLHEIADILEEEKKNVRIIALVNTLEYLKKGGRISAVAYAAGSLFGIKPVIAVEEGKIEVLGKARGSKSGNNMLMQQVEKYGGIDFEKPFALGYSGLTSEKLDKYIKDSAKLYEGKTDNLPIIQIGPTIGTYVGEGAVGFAWFSNEQK